MADFLDNEAARWIIGIVVTILIGVAAIIGPPFIHRKRKRLWYQASIYPLVREELDERITILFDGKAVPNVYVSIIGLRYKGTDPIMEDDYRSPVTFDYEDAQILDAEIFETEPDGINAHTFVKDESKVVFEPIALNDENRIAARVLLSGRNTPKVSGHIVGVKKIVADVGSSVRSIFGVMVASAVFMLISVAIFAYGILTYGVVPVGAEPTAPGWLRASMYVTLAIAIGIQTRAAWLMIKSGRRGQRFLGL
jgi:hypothetical protein